MPEREKMESEKVEQLRKFIQNICQQPDRVIKDGDKLLSSGLIDSFSLIDVALSVEDIFKVRIEDTELSTDYFDTFEELLNLIKLKLNE